MSALLLLVTCFVLGIIVARIGKPPAGLAPALNWWVINVALPALVLQLIARLHIDPDLWFLVVSMWFVFLGAWGFFALIGRAFNWSRQRVGALTLVCGLGNTSFIGFPLIEALRGKEALQLAVVADQPGCFLALATGGTIVAALYSGARVDADRIARRVVLFPAFVALIVGLIVGRLGGWPDFVEPMLDRIGSTLVPLALFSVGLQFRLRFAREQQAAVGLGLGWKLLLAPAIVYLAGRMLPIGEPILAVAVLESAMGPMISAAILADQNDLEPSLANAILGIGIVLSFVTVPLANALL